MGLYEFNAEDAIRFARHVNISTAVRGDELFFKTCPFCHGRGKRNEKTFSINLKTGQFCCFRESCRRTGNMIDLAREFDFSLGNMVDEYYSPKKQFRQLKTPKEPIVPKDSAIEFLAKRGISREIAVKYQITSRPDMPNVLCMPFLDENGVWRFVKYRKTDFNPAKDNNKEWCEANCKPILYGMYQCNLENDTLIITEGQMDSLSVSECGIENAVSVPTGANGFTWIPYCWNWVNHFKKIIVFGDHEKGHITLLDDIKSRFKSEIYHVREEDYKDCKDANEILLKYGKEQVKKCIANAVKVPLPYLLDIENIEDINIYDIEKMPTGIHDLDYMLYGGLPMPSLTVVTGKRSEGKSTFTSQIIANALENNYNCLVYSGELDARTFKSGIYKQLAGRNHTFLYKNKFGNEGYEVSKSNKVLISNWINGRLKVLDNSQIGSNNTVGLLEAIETSIQQYGTRVILLDNLMTALSSLAERNAEKYDLQSQFTQDLTTMAMKYNVLIILVAHKRKNSNGGDEMDDIMGTSDIANLSSVIIGYSRGREDECAENQRMLKLLKNRIFGKVCFRGWVVDFDEHSNRIYGENDNCTREFGWTKQLVDGFDSIENVDREEIPWE